MPVIVAGSVRLYRQCASQLQVESTKNKNQPQMETQKAAPSRPFSPFSARRSAECSTFSPQNGGLCKSSTWYIQLAIHGQNRKTEMPAFGNP